MTERTDWYRSSNAEKCLAPAHRSNDTESTRALLAMACAWLALAEKKKRPAFPRGHGIGYSGLAGQTRRSLGTRWPHSAVSDSKLCGNREWPLRRLLNAVFANDAAPFIVFGADECAERLRGAADRHRARLDDLVTHVRVGKRGVDRIVEFFDQCRRGLRRRQKAYQFDASVLG